MHSPSDAFFRAETSRVAQRTFYACARPAPGQIDGAVVSCTTMAGCAPIGEWGQDRPQVSAHNVLIEGDTAYVAS